MKTINVTVKIKRRIRKARVWEEDFEVSCLRIKKDNVSHVELDKIRLFLHRLLGNA